MNEKPITQSHDVVLRKTDAALHRAARRAREIARQTKTCLVVSRNGQALRIDVARAQVAESPATYDADDGQSP